QVPAAGGRLLRMTTGRPRAFSVSQAGEASGRYGSAQCRAVIPGQSIEQNGAAAEDSASVILRPEITGRAVRPDAYQWPVRLSLCYQGLRTLLLPQCFRAISQRKKRPVGRFASN
ncbi:MAG: hypothetical protein Q8Q26_15210, partial [Pseudorhodobacter sp.]|nr:hypothetical protein [Pseudorhodobacter sp.]